MSGGGVSTTSGTPGGLGTPLFGDDEVVRIKGEGEGTTAAFLAFIRKSPVLDAD